MNEEECLNKCRKEIKDILEKYECELVTDDWHFVSLQKINPYIGEDGIPYCIGIDD